jgi:hypothetical protein
MTRSAALATVVLALCGLVGTAEASFNAAELVYVPVVSHAEGANGSRWRSDVTITNLDAALVDVDVAIVYLPSGFISNEPRVRDRTGMLGGRQSDSFGNVNEALASIPPGGSVVLTDIVGEYWSEVASSGSSGALVVFGYEAESLEPDGSRVPRNILVNSRTYTEDTVLEEDPDNEGEYLEVPTSYGQGLPGVPWYNLADPAVVTEELDLSFQLLIGGAENDDYRYNIGILNASDPQTRITVRLQPFQPDGTPFPNAVGGELSATLTLPPLAHVQYNQALLNLFGLTGNLENVTVKVSIAAWETSSVEPIVGMTAYGSYVDNTSNDPTTVLPSFAYPYDVDCMWTVDTGEGGKGRAGRLPVEIPSL